MASTPHRKTLPTPERPSDVPSPSLSDRQTRSTASTSSYVQDLSAAETPPTSKSVRGCRHLDSLIPSISTPSEKTSSLIPTLPAERNHPKVQAPYNRRGPDHSLLRSYSAVRNYPVTDRAPVATPSAPMDIEAKITALTTKFHSCIAMIRGGPSPSTVPPPNPPADKSAEAFAALQNTLALAVVNMHSHLHLVESHTRPRFNKSSATMAVFLTLPKACIDYYTGGIPKMLDALSKVWELNLILEDDHQVRALKLAVAAMVPHLDLLTQCLHLGDKVQILSTKLATLLLEDWLGKNGGVPGN